MARDAYIYQAALICEPCAYDVIKDQEAAGQAPDAISCRVCGHSAPGADFKGEGLQNRECPNCPPGNSSADYDEGAYDSDEFPKSTDRYASESDVPEHCDICGEFLENDLTSEGQNHVVEAVCEALRNKRPSQPLCEWINFYDYIDDPDVQTYFDTYCEGSVLKDTPTPPAGPKLFRWNPPARRRRAGGPLAKIKSVKVGGFYVWIPADRVTYGPYPEYNAKMFARVSSQHGAPREVYRLQADGTWAKHRRYVDGKRTWPKE